MNLHWQISPGEFFELLRPAAYVLSALLSTWVLASARLYGFRFYFAAAWAVGTFFLPFIILPVYLIACATAKRRTQVSADSKDPDSATRVKTTAIRFRLVAPLLYGTLLLSLVGVYLYRDYEKVDAHLARATQAKLVFRRDKTIREYQAALKLEDNPHTHKLLGIELADAGLWNEALVEFRTAESGGEPDEALPFRIGQALEAVSLLSEARSEYQRFLHSHACTQSLTDLRCEQARRRTEMKPER